MRRINFLSSQHRRSIPTTTTQYCNGEGVNSSWRRAREYYVRAIELGSLSATTNMSNLNTDLQMVRVALNQEAGKCLTQMTSLS